MWDIILAINSFVVWPITAIFFLYSVGRLIFAWDWKLLIIATILVVLSSIAGAIIGIIVES